VANESLTVAQTGVEELYEQTAGPVFAYCYARVGSRSMAEWAVTATFDRARAAVSNGGVPEPELDWLLRTADKFCAPRLRLDGGALAGESVLVLQDWRGRSFDEIEAELTARQARLEEERSRLTPWRRLLGALNLGPALSWAKGLFAGASAVKATAAAVAVVGAIAVVATPIATKLHDAVNPPAKKHAPTRGGGATTPVPAHGTAATPEPGPARSGHAPAAVAATTGAAAGTARSHGVGSSTGASSTSSPSTSSRGGTTPAGHTGGAQPTSSGVAAPTRSGGQGQPTGGGAAPSTSPKPKLPQNQTISPPAPSVKPPTVTASTPTAPTTALPQTPTVSTPTVPSTSDVTPTVPSVSDTPTPTVPSVSTPSVPSTGSAPNPPSVSTPSVPPPPPAPTVTAPTVTLPGK
jgi:DNA-directed RNA polymerase specialized sigma24 family protein